MSDHPYRVLVTGSRTWTDHDLVRDALAVAVYQQIPAVIVQVDSVTGRSYVLAGEPVTVLARFSLPSRRNPLPSCPPWLRWTTPPKGAPRNAAVRWESGHTQVRPFRGLRKPPPESQETP